MERYGTHCEQTYRMNFNCSQGKYINCAHDLLLANFLFNSFTKIRCVFPE